jgi:hypothetical protein
MAQSGAEQSHGHEVERGDRAELREYPIADGLALVLNSATEVEDDIFEVFYDISIGTEPHAGDLDLTYSYPKREVTIGIAIFEGTNKGHGFGRALYEAVPSLPLPRGEDFRESGFRFVSRYRSDEARRVWEALVRDGHAIKQDDDSYELIP